MLSSRPRKGERRRHLKGCRHPAAVSHSRGRPVYIRGHIKLLEKERPSSVSVDMTHLQGVEKEGLDYI